LKGAGLEEFLITSGGKLQGVEQPNSMAWLKTVGAIAAATEKRRRPCLHQFDRKITFSNC
jgi:hypothetical protein